MELSGISYLDDLDLSGRRVFVRVDFNVPLAGGEVRDDARIRAALPTITHLRKCGAHVVLASHLGRPKGSPKADLSLEPCAKRLAELLDCEIRFADDCVGEGVEKVVRDLPEGEVAVLENLRFHAAEEAGDPAFAAKLAEPFDAYVNDAFGTCHRPHASMYGIVRHLSTRCAGFLIQKELEYLGRVLNEPATPFVAILGGAKVSDKIGVIRALSSRCDTILIGGAMAYTFLKAQGVEVGKSLVEEDKLDLASELLKGSAGRKAKIMLPVDHLVAANINADEGIESNVSIPTDMAGFDIGPTTVVAFSDVIAKAGTVFWNGPLGVFEKKPFSGGTFAVARAVARSRAVSVVGGGDSAAAVDEAGLASEISHVSTGGGASLQFMEGRSLPGIEALRSGHQFE
ncbi:MAG: phosphoglycerate kinase [Myxococcales bacterium]|nr:phosphoglycerate kinase [Myxococcales bacterium]